MQRWVARIAMARWGRGLDPAGRGATGAPPSRLLGLVAGLAQTLGVARAGSTAGCVRLDVVEVAYRRTAPGCAAPLVAVHEQRTVPTAEPAVARVHRDQATGHGMFVEPPDPCLSVGRQVAQPGPDERRRERSVPLEHGRLAVVREQGVVRHHHGHLDGEGRRRPGSDR